MSNSVLRIVRASVQTYTSEAESWKRDHAAAMECCDFEDFLEMGVDLFDDLVKIDEKYRARVFAGKEQYDEDDNNAIYASFILWLIPCKIVERALEAFEHKFGTVKHAQEFRARCQEAKSILSDHKEFFGTGLVPLRDDALDENSGDQTIECRSWE